MGGGARGQAGKAVAPFEDRDHAALGIWPGHLQHQARQIVVVLVGQFQAAQRITVPGVETGR